MIHSSNENINILHGTFSWFVIKILHNEMLKFLEGLLEKDETWETGRSMFCLLWRYDLCHPLEAAGN